MAGTTNDVIKLELPKQLTQVMDKLGEYGYSAFVHGECVRLLINGQTLFEYDIMTNAELPRIPAIFEDWKVEQSDDKYIVTVLGIAISITSYVNLEFELAERHTFTYDAITYTLKKQTGAIELHDPFNGISALEKGEIRRLVWTNPEAEITRGDLENILMSKCVKELLNENAEIFLSLMPEFGMLNSPNSPSLVRTFDNVGGSSPLLPLRYALLFCQLGKPDCHSSGANGEDLYYGQAERARIYANRIMTRLGCEQLLIKETEYIIENHQEILHSTRFKKLSKNDLRGVNG